MIANAVSDVIDSGPQHSLRVFPKDDMRRGANAIFVRLVDDSLINLRTHLGTGAEKIIHSHLDEVGFVPRQFIDILATLFRIFNSDGAGNRS